MGLRYVPRTMTAATEKGMYSAAMEIGMASGTTVKRSIKRSDNAIPRRMSCKASHRWWPTRKEGAKRKTSLMMA